MTTDASIGIAMAPRDGSDLDEILKSADLAMYAAKSTRKADCLALLQAGDGCASAGPPRPGNGCGRRSPKAAGSKCTISPVSTFRDNRITGCEALVRWRHPARGMISPADFVPIAEETGLINRLGEWVLTTACQEAATWPAPSQARRQRLAGSVQERHAGALKGDCRAGGIWPRQAGWNWRSPKPC